MGDNLLYWKWVDDDRYAFYVEADPSELLRARKRRGCQPPYLEEQEWQHILVWLCAQALNLIQLGRARGTYLWPTSN